MADERSPDAERYRTLFERSHVGVAFVAVDGPIIDANPAACRLWGRSQEELVGIVATELIHPDDRDGWLANLRRLAHHELEVLRTERRFQRPDGTTVWADSTTQAMRGADGKVVYWQSVLVDITDRKRAEERFQSLLEAAPVAIIAGDLEWEIVLANAHAEHLFGYPPGGLIGQSVGDVFPSYVAAVAAGERSRLATSMAPGESVTVELTARRRDGQEFAAELSLTTIQTDDRWLAVAGIRDTSERELAAIVQSSQDAILGMTLEGTITSWNPGAEQIYGYAANEMVGATVFKLVPADGVEELKDVLATVGEGDRVEQLETRRVRKDGAVIDVSLTVSPIRNAAGAISGASAVARDVTERNRIRADLVSSQERLQAILDNSPAVIWLTDVEGRYQLINREFERIHGVERASVLGATARDLWPDAVAQEQRQAELDVIRTRQPRRSEEVHDGPEGERTYVSVVFPLFDTRGKLYATAGLWTDITERKAAEAERQSLQERMRQADRLESLGQLAGGVAHDFNNLLNAILAYANFIADAAADQPVVRSDAEEITVAAQHAVRLTRQLLLFARRAPAEPKILDLNAVLADTGNLLGRTIGEHIELVIRAAPALPAIRADRGQVEQVVMNLAVNARDAMPAGGRLTIETRDTELDEEYTRLHPDVRPGRYLELAVSDTGVGMSPEVVAHICEPFYTTKPRGEGTGLGLATVYGVLTDSGGGLGVYSEEGKGTTVRAYFPAQEIAVGMTGTAPMPTSVVASGTILVVEDEQSVMKTTTRILRQRGYRVLEATNGSEALALAADPDLQLVLTDSVMPKMSGRDLAQRVAQLRPEVPVLLMSGYSEGVLNPSHDAGENLPLLQKPFTAHELVERVHAMIAQRDR